MVRGSSGNGTFFYQIAITTIDYEQSLFPLRDSQAKAKDHENRLQCGNVAHVFSCKRHVSTREVIFVIALVFFLLRLSVSGKRDCS